MRFRILNNYVLIEVDKIKKKYVHLRKITNFRKIMYDEVNSSKKFDFANFQIYQLENDKERLFSYIVFINNKYYYIVQEIETAGDLINKFVEKANDVTDQEKFGLLMMRKLKMDIGKDYLSKKYFDLAQKESMFSKLASRKVFIYHQLKEKNCMGYLVYTMKNFDDEKFLGFEQLQKKLDLAYKIEFVLAQHHPVSKKLIC